MHVDPGATCEIQNTIFYNADGASCGGLGTITSLGNNIEDDTSCGFATQNTDALLNALAENGGPTQTHSLQLLSPAIDTGDNTACAAAPINNVDQRGQTRPVNGGISNTCDVGAYEYTP